MPENNVTVTVTADASQAKREIDSFTQTVAADSQKISSSLRGSGSGLADVGQAAERAGQRASGAFRMVETIVERMLIRLIAIKLIFDAINAVARLIGESMRWEAASAQFRALTDNSKTAAADLERFQRAARETGISAEEFVKMDESLQGIGESARNAADDALLLGQYAKYSGEGFEKIMRDMRAMRLGTGTIDQMRELVNLEGEFGTTSKESINALERQDAELKKQQQDLNQIDELENRRFQLQRRNVDESQRHADAIEEFGNKLGLGDAVLQRMAQGLSASGAQMHIIRGGWEVATVNLSAAGSAMERMMQIGNRRIMQEEGISQTSLRQLEQYGLIDSSFVLSAYHRQMEDQRRRQEWAHEDAAAVRHMGILIEQNTVIQTQRALQAQIAGEIGRGTNLEQLKANYSNTAAAAMGRFQQALANIARDLPGLVQNLAKAADAAARLADAMERVTSGKAGEQARAQEAAQISARFFPTGGAPTPAHLGFGTFPAVPALPATNTEAGGTAANTTDGKLDQILAVLSRHLAFDQEVFG